MKKGYGVRLFVFLLLSGTVLFAEEAAVSDNSANAAIHQWDKNATAQSLGLEPFQMPDDIYPLYPWDHIAAWGYSYQPKETAIEMMAECNFTMPGFVYADEAELCAENGLKYIVEAELPFSRDKIPALTIEEAEEYIQKTVESTKNDPNCIGYYLIDEPGANLFPGLAKLVAAVKKYAPGKLAYINLFPSYASTIGADRESQLQTYSYEEYLERYIQEVKPQFISYDNYMVEYSEDMSLQERAAIYWRDLLMIRNIAQKYQLPWWNIVSSICILKESSAPAPARLAFQAYTSLAAGADGLGWYLYYPIEAGYSPIDKSGRKTLTWSYQQVINDQIRVLGKVLKAYDSTSVWFSDLVPVKEPVPAEEPVPVKEPVLTEKLPTNPGDVVKEIQLSWSPNGGEISDTPSVMVGQFKAKDGTHDAVMVVNLNFGRSVKVEAVPTEEGKNITAVSPIDGQTDERPSSGWWILPGHGRLFIIR